MHHRVKDHTWLKIAREDALREQRGRCRYCFEPLAYRTATAEHRKPRSAGGGNGRDNIAASCQPCNSLKGSLGERAFVRDIKAPPTGSPVRLWLAWSRRRVNLATMRACRGILRSAGLDDSEFRT